MKKYKREKWIDDVIISDFMTAPTVLSYTPTLDEQGREEIAQVLSGLEQDILLQNVEKGNEIEGLVDPVISDSLLPAFESRPENSSLASESKGNGHGRQTIRKRKGNGRGDEVSNQPQSSGDHHNLPFPEMLGSAESEYGEEPSELKQEEHSPQSHQRKKRRSWVARKTIEKNISRFSNPELHIPVRCLNGNMSKHCKVCNVSRPVTMCSECDVFVCIEAIGTARCPTIKDTCWYTLHHAKSFVAQPKSKD
jgi:hypothetical protein